MLGLLSHSETAASWVVIATGSVMGSVWKHQDALSRIETTVAMLKGLLATAAGTLGPSSKFEE